MTNKENINSLSNHISLVSFILVIMTVIYSTDNYDVWDSLTSIAILSGLIKFRKIIILSYLNSVLIFRIGISICSSVFLISLFSLLSGQPKPTIITSDLVYIRLFQFFDIEFLLSTLIFLITLLISKKKLTK